jgi:hypothetical protein
MTISHPWNLCGAKWIYSWFGICSNLPRSRTRVEVNRIHKFPDISKIKFFVCGYMKHVKSSPKCSMYGICTYKTGQFLGWALTVYGLTSCLSQPSVSALAAVLFAASVSAWPWWIHGQFSGMLSDFWMTLGWFVVELWMMFWGFAMISWAMHGEPHGPKKGGDPQNCKSSWDT